MLTSKRALVLALALVACAGLGAAQKRKKQVVQPVPNPPTVALSAEAQTVTLCPRDASLGAARVRLNANASSPDGLPLRYTWKTTGGRIEGDGAETVWDLTDAAPGTYIASVDVTTGDARCTAFASVPVAVIECPPVREVCPNISISCPDAVAVRATLTVNGYGGLNCAASCATPVQAGLKPRHFDEFGELARNDVKARLDVFA